jgi:tetratricopeptide (TPR) repeat protein
MSFQKTGVFLASRFAEFSELRKALKSLIANHRQGQLAPIDLNDGAISHRPPITECLSYVRRSEFMILLLGDTYGSLAPKSDKSFTHLEYEEAIKDSGKRVLVFGIGEQYRDGCIRFSDDANLANWQRQVESEHTLGFFDPDTPIAEMAKAIFDALLASLYEMSLGARTAQADDALPEGIFDDFEDENLFDESEVRSLDERNTGDLSLIDDRSRFRNELQVLTQPAAIQAMEQREEAQRALDIGEYGIAIGHLKRALEIKPLELISNYWLAQLYVALDRKEKSNEAMEMAIRAARVAMRDKLPYRAAAAYAIGAKAAVLAKKPDYAFDLAQKGVEAAPRFARAHLELSRQHVLRSDIPAAIDSLKQAYFLYPRSIREIFVDPIFKPLRSSCNTFIAEQKAKVADDVQALLRLEAQMAARAGTKCPDINLAGKSYSELIREGRQCVLRQADFVCRFLADAADKFEELLAAPPKLPPSTKEAFNFNGSNRVRIVEWHKAPGETIAPEDVVFSFQYENRPTIKPWTWRARFPVRMTERAGDDGVLIADSNPFIFEHVPADIPLPQTSHVHKLKENIRLFETRVEFSWQDLHEAQEQEHLTEQKLQQAKKTGINTPGTPAIVAGIALVLWCAWLMAHSQLTTATIAAITATICLLFGHQLRSAHHQHMEKLQREHTLAATKHEEAEKLWKERTANLNALQNEFDTLETTAKALKERAETMLKLFEHTGLRHGRLSPVPSIHSARVGDIIRVTDKQLEDFLAHPGRRVDILDDMPTWLDYTATNTKAKLLYVVSVTPQLIILSRRSAYPLVSAPQNGSVNVSVEKQLKRLID